MDAKEMLLKYNVAISNNGKLYSTFLNKTISLPNELLELYNDTSIPIETRLINVLSSLYKGGHKELEDIIKYCGLFSLVVYCPECQLPYFNFDDYCDRLITYRLSINPKLNSASVEVDEGDEEFKGSRCPYCDAVFEKYSTNELIHAVNLKEDICIHMGLQGEKYYIFAGLELLNYLCSILNYDTETADKILHNNREFIHEINNKSSYLIFSQAIEYNRLGYDAENGDKEEWYIKQIQKCNIDPDELEENQLFNEIKSLNNLTFEEALIDYAWTIAQRINKLQK